MTHSQPPLSPEQIAEQWDKVAPYYEAGIASQTVSYAEDALHLLDLQVGEQVLDVAAGTGSFSLAAARSGAQVLAIDFSPQMTGRIQSAIRRDDIQNLRTAVMDGQALDLAAGTFDAAASVFGVILFPDRARGLSEIHRVLKPGGRTAVVSWSTPDSFKAFQLLMLAIRNAVPDLPSPSGRPPIFSIQTAQELHSEMTAAGFRDVEVTTVVHNIGAPNAEEMWNLLRHAAPAVRGILERAGVEREELVHSDLVRMLQDEFGGGPVSLPAEALIGVGVK